MVHLFMHMRARRSVRGAENAAKGHSLFIWQSLSSSEGIYKKGEAAPLLYCCEIYVPIILGCCQKGLSEVGLCKSDADQPP